MSTLLSDITGFCTAHGLSKSDFGQHAMNDRRFVHDLMRGRRCWPETEAKARDFMAAYAPKQVAA